MSKGLLTQEFSVAGVLPGLNEMLDAAKGPHGKHTYHQLKQLWERTIGCEILVAKVAPLHGPAHFGFVWYEPVGKRDPDNVVVAKKFIFDTLVGMKIIPGDSRKWVAGLSDSFVYENACGWAGVKVTISPIRVREAA